MDIFPMGLTFGFGPKMAIFPTIFLCNIGQELSFTIFQNEKTPLQAIKTRSFKKLKNRHFSNGLTDGFGPNMAIFPTFFLAIIGQENLFYDILERKIAFPGFKNNKFRKLKNRHFSNGLMDCFGPNMAIFPTFFFEQYRPKMSFTIFQNEKTPSQAIKTRSLKSRKIEIFPKGLTHGFGPKMAIFATFFFRQYRPGKCLLRYSRTKKRLSRL